MHPVKMKILLAAAVLGFVAMGTEAKSLSNAEFFEMAKDYISGKVRFDVLRFADLQY